MQVRVQQWGNSLALRIPKPFAQEIHVKKGSTVDLAVDKRRLILVPVSRFKYTLKGLLAGVTKENIHHEVDFGKPAGQEVW